MPPESRPPAASAPTSHSLVAWVECHFAAILYGWFFFGMVLCGLLAPTGRVLELESGLVSEGWHLSVLAVLLGTPPLVAYWWRMRSDPQENSD